MNIKIKSAIPIRYEQEDIEQLCQLMNVTYVSHERSDFYINLQIEEELSPTQINDIRNQINSYILSKIIEISVNI